VGLNGCLHEIFKSSVHIQQIRPVVLFPLPSVHALLLAVSGHQPVGQRSLLLQPLSVVSPAVNTGKVLVTVFVGRVLGEQQVSAKKWLGLLLLLSGVVLQITA